MIEVELRKNKENKFVIALLGLNDVKCEELQKAVYYVGAKDRFPRMQAEALAFDDEEEAVKVGIEVYNNILNGRRAEQERKAWRRHVSP